jgi:hypothetical protein
MPIKPTKIVAQAEYDIPANLSREVGRINIRWAFFEHAIRRVIWTALGVDPKIGRTAIRDPRIDDLIGMIEDIGYLRKFKVDRIKLKNLVARANEVKSWRDLAAHGLWIPDANGWFLQLIRGNYPKNSQAEHPKRRINPEGVRVDIDGLRTVTRGIEMLINDALELRKLIAEQLPPSPDKHQAP